MSHRPLIAPALFALVALVAALAAALAALPAAAQTYRLIDLGTLGGAHSCANAINAKGEIVGVSTVNAGDIGGHAVLWSGGKRTDLGTFGELAYSEAIGISDNGAIVGQAYMPANPSVQRRALSFAAGKSALLGAVSAAKPDAEAYDVNDAGLSVGRALVGDPGTARGGRAMVASKGAVTLLERFEVKGLGTFTPEAAAAVNKRGMVAGWASVRVGDRTLRRAFRWTKGGSEDPLLAYDQENDTYAMDVNEAGDLACGLHVRLDGANPDAPGIGGYQALIVRGDQITRVDPLAGCENAELHALNARGDAVGMCWASDGSARAFVVRKGVTLDPNDLLAAPSEWKITLLTDLNDAGQIVGVATKGKESHAVLLEPSGTNGMGLAAAGVEAAAATPTWVTAFAGPRPNPAIGTATQFAFTLARPATVSVTLSNVSGRIVRRLSGSFEAGPGTLAWDGRDDAGARVGSGVLFARYALDGVTGVRKVILAN